MARRKSKTMVAERSVMRIAHESTSNVVSEARKSLEAAARSVDGKQAKIRHRASVACANCRMRRIRCVVLPGETSCNQCNVAEIACIITNDDERKRPISRSYVRSLTTRIALLETMIREQGGSPPPPITSSASKQDDLLQDARSPKRQKVSAGSSGEEQQDAAMQTTTELRDSSEPELTTIKAEETLESDNAHSQVTAIGSPVVSASLPEIDRIVQRLLSNRGYLSFNELNTSGRYFGPTTNCHVHIDSWPMVEKRARGHANADRIMRLINGLSSDTCDYLDSLFWVHYNSYMHVVHREAFLEDKRNGNVQFYSDFLHACVLAMGCRFADRARPDIQRLTTSPYESYLHLELKAMLDTELERPSGIPIVTALLILGDLECAAGRDSTGWLYAGMANRIAVDIGLNLDSRVLGLSQQEADIRRMTLWACVIYDRYWALFLGRTSNLQTPELEVDELATLFDRLSSCDFRVPEKPIGTQIYESLLGLMQLTGRLSDDVLSSVELRGAVTATRDAFERLVTGRRELYHWYASLPSHLKLNIDNVESAPLSLLLLHQQYHVVLILLHRPFARHIVDDSVGSGSDAAIETDAAHAISGYCTQQAIRVARLIWHQRRRFDGQKVPITCMQHAGTAATAIIAALASTNNDDERVKYTQCLKLLSAALQDMSCIYQPAAGMALVLQAVLAEVSSSSSTRSRYAVADKLALITQKEVASTVASHVENTTSSCQRSTVDYNLRWPALSIDHSCVEQAKMSRFNIYPHNESALNLFEISRYQPAKHRHHASEATGTGPDSFNSETALWLPADYGSTTSNMFDSDLGNVITSLQRPLH